jgi:hypothetical protein
MYKPVHRSKRSEALKARQRISEIYRNEMIDSDLESDSESDLVESVTAHIIQDKNYKYTLNVIRYLINECNNAPFEVQRTQIIEKIFEHLNKNPDILIYEPKFRTSVINKMKELEDHISTRIYKYNNAKYHTIVNNIKASIQETVRNSVMRTELNKHLSAITDIFTEYEEWSKGTSLMKQINELYHHLERIKKDPSYIVSKE